MHERAWVVNGATQTRLYDMCWSDDKSCKSWRSTGYHREELKKVRRERLNVVRTRGMKAMSSNVEGRWQRGVAPCMTPGGEWGKLWAMGTGVVLRETSLECDRRIDGFREHVEVDGSLNSLSWCGAALDSRQQCSWIMNRRTKIVVRAVRQNCVPSLCFCRV